MKMLTSDFIFDFHSRYKFLKYRILTETRGENCFIDKDDVKESLLFFSKHFQDVIEGCIYLWGPSEQKYLNNLLEHEDLTEIFDYDIPLFVFSDGGRPSEEFLKKCDENELPVLSFEESVSDLKKYLLTFLEDKFAPQTVVHGDLIEVFGIGILITGESGIGKSETTLELVQRNHRFITDDMVVIKRMSGNFLFGSGSKIAPYFMEIRGIGIIDIAKLFGVSAVRNKKRVQMEIHLEMWKQEKKYDRIGIIGKTTEILGINIPYVIIPVKPGRNIPSIIETAALNFRLKQLGINSAFEFNNKLRDWMKKEKNMLFL